MRSLVVSALMLLALSACADEPLHIAEYWRPISEPNLQMPLERAQKKLDYDLSQCHCGIYPSNVTHSDVVAFSPDQQRIAQTGVVVTPDAEGSCSRQPSLVVSECMRHRGWEITTCSGRVPVAGGGALCAAYAY